MGYSENAFVLSYNASNFKNPIVAGQQLENVVRYVISQEYGVTLQPWPTHMFGELQTPRDEYYRGVSLFLNNQGRAEISIISAINNDGNLYIDFGMEQSLPYNSNEEVMESIRQACIKCGLTAQNSTARKPDPSMVEQPKGGCYVATAVYGSYNCPEVWTLRRYRDFELAEHWYGRAFIRIYYAISPTIVKWFGSYKWFNDIWRNKLDMMVEKLQKKGYESSPYSDREW